MSASINTAKRFVKLAKEKKKLETELKKIKEEMGEVEENLIDYFQRHSLKNLGAEGSTVYIHQQVYASLPDKIEAQRMLVKHGYGDMVEPRVMPQRLSAWVREMLNEVEDIPSSDNLADSLPLPVELKQQIKVTEKYSIRVKNA